MKTLRMSVLAFIVILLSGSFTSCSKDENPENDGDYSNEKKLVKLVYKGETGGDLEVFTFKYDSKGRLIESTNSIDYGEYVSTSHYTWEDNVIMINDTRVVALENGLIESTSVGWTFTYNSLNRITKFASNNDIATVTWDGDKIVSLSSYIGSDMIFTYGETCRKGYCPLIPYLLLQYDDLSIAHPELIGARSKQLPTMIGGIYLKYEFDNDGYITKIDINQSTPMILTWE